MRITRIVVGAAVVLAMGAVSGCRCEVTVDNCGDGICDASEGTECSDCTFEVGESLDTDVAASDFLTSELGANFGINGTDVEAAFDLAKPNNAPYSFDDWCAGGSGCSTWIAFYANSTGNIVVRATGPVGPDYTDFVMICEAPDGTLFANDDFDTTDCINNGVCDPGMALSGAGIWTCLVAAAPFPLTNTDGFGPVTISASAS